MKANERTGTMTEAESHAEAMMSLIESKDPEALSYKADGWRAKAKGGTIRIGVAVADLPEGVLGATLADPDGGCTIEVSSALEDKITLVGVDDPRKTYDAVLLEASVVCNEIAHAATGKDKGLGFLTVRDRLVRALRRCGLKGVSGSPSARRKLYDEIFGSEKED